MNSTVQNIVVPSIENSVMLDTNYPLVKDRYFTHYYYIPKKQIVKENTSPPPQEDNHDINALNSPLSKKAKIDAKAVVENDDAMEIEDNSKEVIEDNYSEVDYNISGEETLVMIHSNKLCVVSLSPYHPLVRNNIPIVKVEYEVFGVDRLSNKVSGKGKRGAQVMGSRATICRLHGTDGQTYDVTCGARGKLVEVNERLVSSPDLARRCWGAEGYLAVVMPRLPDFNTFLSSLTTAKRYEELWTAQHSA